MYQMLTQIVAELPLHLALFACGAFGWAVTKWANRRFCNARLQARGKCADALSEDAASSSGTPVATPVAAVSTPTQGHSGKARRRARGKVETSLEDEVEAAPEPAAALTEAAREVEAAAEPAAAAVAAGPEKTSERVARLLAKKAERKARKVAEMQRPQELEGPVPQVRPAEPPSAPAAAPAAQPAARTTEAAAAAVASAASPRKARVSALELRPPPAWESGERTTWSRITEEEPADLPPKLAQRLGLPVHHQPSDTDLAELSTADEGTRSAWEGTWNEAEDSYEENEDAEEAREDAECEEPPQDCLPEVPRRWVQPMAEGQDGWMMPLEDLQELSRQESQGPFVQHADPNMHLYQPIISPDGQQLYTDGEQVYMMACVELQAHTMQQPQVVHPVVHPCDPLHEVVMGTMSGGRNYWGSSSPYECYSQNPYEHHCAQVAFPEPEEDKAWDVCWDFIP